MVRPICRGYQWRYGEADDAARARMVSCPLGACKTLPAPERRSNDEDDHSDHRSRRRHRSRSLWDRLGGRRSSRSREPVQGGRGTFTEENRGRQRAHEEGDSRGFSRHLSRTIEPGETRIRRQSVSAVQRSSENHAPLQSNKNSTKVGSPCKSLSSNRSKSPDAGSAPSLPSPAVPVDSPDLAPLMQVSGAVLDILEKHLDPMIHEAEMAHALYSPDTTLPRPVSPVFILSDAGQETQASPVRGEQQVDAFIADLSTPLQQPLLPAPGEKQQRLCRNKVTISVQHQSARLATKARQNSKFESFAQEILANKFGVLDDNKRLDARIKSLYLQQYKKPLSPAAVKTIAALVEKGGCKAVRLKEGRRRR